MVAAGELGMGLAEVCWGEVERREVEGWDGEVGAELGLVDRRRDAERARPVKVAAAIDRGVRRGEVSTSLRSAATLSELLDSPASCMLAVGLGILVER